MAKHKKQPYSPTVRETGKLEVTICDVDGHPLYLIKPHSQGLCYELYKWRSVDKKDGTKTEEWKTMNSYPWDLAYACDIIFRDVILNHGGKIDELDDLKRHVLRCARLIRKGVEDAFNGRE